MARGSWTVRRQAVRNPFLKRMARGKCIVRRKAVRNPFLKRMARGKCIVRRKAVRNPFPKRNTAQFPKPSASFTKGVMKDVTWIPWLEVLFSTFCAKLWLDHVTNPNVV
jgi:hypothetical protein